MILDSYVGMIGRKFNTSMTKGTLHLSVVSASVARRRVGTTPAFVETCAFGLTATPLDEWLVTGRQRTRLHLRNRLVAEGLKQHGASSADSQNGGERRSACDFTMSTAMGSTIVWRTFNSFARTATARRIAGADATGAEGGRS